MATGAPVSTRRRRGQSQEDKIRENRLRGMAKRQGLEILARGLRDPRAIGYGTYRLIMQGSGTVVMTDVTLDEIERYLQGER